MRPRANTVLPAPRSPKSATKSPGSSHAAWAAATVSVAASLAASSPNSALPAWRGGNGPALPEFIAVRETRVRSGSRSSGPG